MRVTKIFNFDSAHQLRRAELSDGENEKLFGRCREVHGHSWTLHVTYEGEVDLVSGMVINFLDLKKIVEEKVIEVFDHHMLNDFVELPTCENLLLDIAARLRSKLSGLVELRLYETPTSCATWKSVDDSR